MPVSSYDEAEKKLRKYLSSNGLRCTVERLAILKSLWENGGHPSAEMIANSLAQGPLYVSRATVYRTLDLLVEAGLLSCSNLGEGHRHYEINVEHHDHLICRRCGRIIEVQSPELEELQRKICREADFVHQSHTLEIVGLCGDCNRELRKVEEVGGLQARRG
ncbi:MAG: transcriptional repressor [Candidatus Coatesbacteria bacterium]|nr:transcriptional repressor [Candidatus Coatesbacteria bacterium]